MNQLSPIILVSIAIGVLLFVTLVIMVVRLLKVFRSAKSANSRGINNPYYDLIKGHICYGGKHRIDTRISEFGVYDATHPYGYNATTVFFKNHSMPQAIPASFRFLEKVGNFFYSTDEKKVFLNEHHIVGADPKTFHVFDHSEFSADEYFAYYKNKKISGSHGATFEVLQNNYARDKNNYYLRQHPVAFADIPHNIVNDNSIGI